MKEIPTPSPQAQIAIEHLDFYGYCVIEDAISSDAADRMAAHYFGLHRENFQGDEDGAYQTLFGLMNQDTQCWECAGHPLVLEVVRHFLGQEARIGEACSKWVKPGAAMGPVHSDSTGDLPAVLPDQPWMINSIWMITDFTPENGATLVVPFSHRARRRPPRGMQPSDPLLKPVIGRRGSVFLWSGALWHASGANTTQDVDRMALNIAYYPPWWNLAREGGHQPVKPEMFAQMPPEMQRLNQHRVGTQRAALYERP